MLIQLEAVWLPIVSQSIAGVATCMDVTGYQAMAAASTAALAAGLAQAAAASAHTKGCGTTAIFMAICRLHTD